MIIVRENFSNVESFHRQHRNAIGQTVAFVQTLFVKIECFEKNVGQVRNVLSLIIVRTASAADFLVNAPYSAK